MRRKRGEILSADDRTTLQELCRRFGKGQVCKMLPADPHTLRRLLSGDHCDEYVVGRVERFIGNVVVHDRLRPQASWDAVAHWARFDYLRDAPALLVDETPDARRDYFGMLRVLQSSLPVDRTSVDAYYCLAHLHLCFAHLLTYSGSTEMSAQAADAARAAVDFARGTGDALLSTVAMTVKAEACYVGGSPKLTAAAYALAMKSATALHQCCEKDLLRARITYRMARSADSEALGDMRASLVGAISLAGAGDDPHDANSAIRYFGLALLRLGDYGGACSRIADALAKLEHEKTVSASSWVSCRKYFGVALGCDGNINMGEKVLCETLSQANRYQFAHQKSDIIRAMNAYDVKALRSAYGAGASFSWSDQSKGRQNWTNSGYH